MALDYAYELEPEREAYGLDATMETYESGPALWTVVHRAKLGGAPKRPGGLTDLVFQELGQSRTDFRTIDSLARSLGRPSSQIRVAVEQLIQEGKVRRPRGANKKYADWIRLTSAGPTARERWRWYRAMAGRTGVDE